MSSPCPPAASSSSPIADRRIIDDLFPVFNVPFPASFDVPFQVETACRRAAVRFLDRDPMDGPRTSRSRHATGVPRRRALRDSCRYIGTEHILLALLEREDGDGALSGLGVDRAAVETQLATALAAIVAGRKA
ncbi:MULTISPECIES: Clp protease N-terminal domain-containing protein [unclassified Frankia]|uniref:Clp protease N-terminal domain-containing protein n=1 Tax=unclassified Frankia TaxID=2632575 RepID=UPI00202585F9